MAARTANPIGTQSTTPTLSLTFPGERNTADRSIPAFRPDEDERAGGLAQKNGSGEGGHMVCAILSPLAIPWRLLLLQPAAHTRDGF
jgi:hypothetical protein